MPALFCFLLCTWVSIAVANAVEKHVGEKNTVARQVEADDNEEEVGTFLGLSGHFFIGLVIGTKWCGPGNVSRSIYDLGSNSEVDICCRSHDLCRYTIPPHTTQYGLYNSRPFTAVSCYCDQKFRSCLEYINSPTSRAVVIGYSFSFPKCFVLKENYFCTYHNGNKRCIHYIRARYGRLEVESGDMEFEYDYDKAERKLEWLDSSFHSVEQPEFVPGTVINMTTEIPMTTTAISERSGGNYKTSQNQDLLLIQNTDINLDLQKTNILDQKYDQTFIPHPQPSQNPVWGGQTGNNFPEQETNNLDHQHQELQPFYQYQNQPRPQYQPNQQQLQYPPPSKYPPSPQYPPRSQYPPPPTQYPPPPLYQPTRRLYPPPPHPYQQQYCCSP